RASRLPAAAVIERARLFVGSDSGLTHVAGALGTPTVAIHLGFPPETCAALGERVEVVVQQEPFADPARTTPADVLAAIDRLLSHRYCATRYARSASSWSPSFVNAAAIWRTPAAECSARALTSAAR